MGLENFYRSKRVLITGNTGFKGGWLTLWLSYLGADIKGFSQKPPTIPSFFELTKLDSLIPQALVSSLSVKKGLLVSLEQQCNKQSIMTKIVLL